jgi:hypothetical protein
VRGQRFDFVATYRREQKLPLSCGQRVTFCRTTKSHQKTFFFLTYGLVRERTSLIRARTARILRAITVNPD